MVLVFVGSRANFGRLKAVIDELLLKGISFGIILGSYDLPQYYQKYVVFKIDNLLYKDTTFNMVSSMSLVAMSITNYLSNLSRLPKLAIVHGDRFENLGFAIACSYNNIKLLHTEGGETSGNIDNKVRSAITALSDIHCTTSSHSRKSLISSGIDKSKVYVVGSPAIDEVKKIDFKVCKFFSSDYILVLYNPCAKDDFDQFFRAILKISQTNKVIWVNPNIDPGYRAICKQIHAKKQIEFIKGLNPELYYRYMYNCLFMIGNSSSGIKEGAYLGVPYIMVGMRQNNRETTRNVIVRTDSRNYENIVYYALDYTKRLFEMNKSNRIEYDGTFGIGDASEKIVKIVKETLERG